MIPSCHPSQCLESNFCLFPLLTMLQPYFLLSSNMLSSLTWGILHLLFFLPETVSSFRHQLKHHLFSKTFSDHLSPSGKLYSMSFSCFIFF